MHDFTAPSGHRSAARPHTGAKFPLFDSFFLAGFEGSVGWNVHREWFDQIEATQHDRHADADYRKLRETGLLAARDSIRWPLVDVRGKLDFRSAQPLVDASRRHGVQVIWDLFHYGYPADLDPFSDEFVTRFAAYCHAAAQFVRRHQDGTCYFTPVNEPSFLAWAGGEVGLFAPHLHAQGPRLKLSLVKAAIAGIEAIWAAVPDARIVNVDPLCHVVAPRDRLLHVDPTDFNKRAVFEAWDMIGGRVCPELGGSRRHLDIIGVNYYWTNQWEIGTEDRPLAFDDPRRVPLARLLRGVARRYGGDILITETAHVDDMRPIWMNSLADCCEQLLEEGVPVRGACLYPILGMPEWHDRATWTRMGLWDLELVNGTLRRVPYDPLHDALRHAQRLESKFSEFRPAAKAPDRAEPTGEWLR